jgi:hypothetical protein
MWRDKPATEKQLGYIEFIQEFAYSAPRFDGTTRGEASDYINKYVEEAKLELEASSPMFGYE